MKCIVLFGAGKSSSVLIEYLKDNSVTHNWQVFVADASLEAAAKKTGEHTHVTPVQVDVYDEEERASLVKKADVVISLLPPSFHILVAKDCVQYSRHLLTASYIDDSIRALEQEIQNKDLLFLCEMGLDPGIDHMSAVKMIHNIQNKGGVITSFKSHCGGLVAPESDDNPWHYKISWNPRNIVMAGKAGAAYKDKGQIVSKQYTEVFFNGDTVAIPTLTPLCWYPNRDSLSYIKLYQLEEAHTFMRTTLRRPEFIEGWRNIVSLRFTDETIFYDTDNLSVADFFQKHYEHVHFKKWRNEILEKDVHTAEFIKEQLAKIEAEEKIVVENGAVLEPDFMLINEKGNLITVNHKIDREKASKIADYLYLKVALSLEQLFYLGLEDETLINKGVCSVDVILQFLLERKLLLLPDDKDMVVMLHEIEYTLNNEPKKESSYLIVKGQNNVQTAMAKTVGLPLGIAAKLLLEGSLTERGLHIPILPAIYNPVLAELKQYGIEFIEF